MPELPEVEVVRQSLNKKIKGKIIKKVIVKNRNLRFKVPFYFERSLNKQKVIKLDRFSKYLILYLFNKKICLIHLGMTGTIHLTNNKKNNLVTNTSFYKTPILPNKHNHIIILFDNFKMVYNDPRRFGFFEIINDYKSLNKRFKKFGPEPMNNNFNFSYIYYFLKNKEKNIKNFLLDQKFVSGIGNIYASEILYLSKINPTKKAKHLNKNDLKKILINSRKVLMNAIYKGGSSIRDFKNISGKKGEFQKNFSVYQREGLNCKRPNCDGVIKKKNISKRSSYFCNSCQKR